MPGSAACTFNKAESFVKMNGFRVIGADVQPDVIHFSFAGMLHGTDGEGTCNAAATIIRMGGNIGDEIEAMLVLPEWHKADVANDVMSFFPDIPCER